MAVPFTTGQIKEALRNLSTDCVPALSADDFPVTWADVDPGMDKAWGAHNRSETSKGFSWAEPLRWSCLVTGFELGWNHAPGFCEASGPDLFRGEAGRQDGPDIFDDDGSLQEQPVRKLKGCL